MHHRLVLFSPATIFTLKLHFTYSQSNLQTLHTQCLPSQLFLSVTFSLRQLGHSIIYHQTDVYMLIHPRLLCLPRNLSQVFSQQSSSSSPSSIPLFSIFSSSCLIFCINSHSLLSILALSLSIESNSSCIHLYIFLHLLMDYRALYAKYTPYKISFRMVSKWVTTRNTYHL